MSEEMKDGPDSWCPKCNEPACVCKEEQIGKSDEEVAKEAAGVKDEVKNVMAVKDVEKSEEAEDNFDYPSLFVDEEDRIRVNVQILFDKKNGKPVMMAVVQDPKGGNSELKYLKRTVEWAEFTIPDYDDMVAFRQNSTHIDRETDSYAVDPIRMRLCYLRYHLKDWSIKDKDGNPVPLERDGRALTKECFEKIGKVSPSLIDLFLTEFEREAMLVS